MEKEFYQILIKENKIQIPKSLHKAYKKVVIKRNSNPIIFAQQKFNNSSDILMKKK